jgi:hypothetical protein
MRKFLLIAALLAGACSSEPAKPKPPVESVPTEAELAATKPMSIRLATGGDVNAMPSIAASGDRIAVVWTGTTKGAMNVYIAVSEDGGVTFPIQKRVNDRNGDVSSNVEQPPRVAVSASDVVVVWTSKRSGSSAIRLSRSKDRGHTFSPAVTIHSPALKGARGWESAAIGSDGLVRVAWLDGRNAQGMAEDAARKRHMAEMAAKGAAMDHSKMSSGSPRQDVYEAVIDQNGKIAETQVATNVCFCCKTAVAVGPSGRVMVAWRNIFPGSIRDIAAAISTDGGRQFGPLARVSEDKWEIAGCPEDGPSMAIDPADIAHIAWPTVVNEGQQQKAVFYSLTKDGRTFAPRVRLSRPDQEEASHPQIAFGQGVAAVVWDEPHAGGVRQVMLRTVGANGKAGGSRTLSGATTASYPVIAPVADGFLVAWTEGQPAAAYIVIRRVADIAKLGQTVEEKPAQGDEQKPLQKGEHAFRGKVVSVDAGAGTLMVEGETADGWMAPITKLYGVDNRAIVGRAKPGDQIRATVFEGDAQTLHGVKILP